MNLIGKGTKTVGIITATAMADELEKRAAFYAGEEGIYFLNDGNFSRIRGYRN